MKYLIATSLLLAAFISASAAAHPDDLKSIQALDELLAKNPTEPSLLITRGSLYTHSGQWDKAEKDLLLAAKLGEKANVAFELAKLYFHTGAFSKSLLYVKQYLDINPDYTTALLLQARIAEAAQHNEIAIKSYRTYLEKTANPHPGDYLASAQLLSKIDRNGITRAIKVLDAGISKIGLNPQLQRYAMKLELDRGEELNAMNRWYSLKHQLGDTPQYKITLVQLLILTHKIEEAKQITHLLRNQLSELKKTPANKALAKELVELERQLG